MNAIQALQQLVAAWDEAKTLCDLKVDGALDLGLKGAARRAKSARLKRNFKQAIQKARVALVCAVPDCEEGSVTTVPISVNDAPKACLPVCAMHEDAAREDRTPYQAQIARFQERIEGKSPEEVDRLIQEMGNMGANESSSLQPYFSLVSDKSDWKKPIDATIPVNLREVVSDAISFFTATEAVFEEVDPNTLRVTAKGYRRGPAGDH